MYDRKPDASGAYRYGSYFHDKKRAWEAQIRMTFKQDVDQASVSFGMELTEHVPMNTATKRSLDGVVGLLRRALGAGDNLYHSTGDAPTAPEDEGERPIFALLLWAFDQVIATPEGQQAPDLAGPRIEHMGSKRSTGMRQFKKQVDHLQPKAGRNYTFCFWGASQWVDKLNWTFKMPLMRPLSCSAFCGNQPVSVVMYSLKPADETHERQQLQTRRSYLLNVAFWSSQARPPAHHLHTVPGGHLAEAAAARRGEAGDATARNATVRGLVRAGDWRALFEACCGYCTVRR